jgi:hypothetical protein
VETTLTKVVWEHQEPIGPAIERERAQHRIGVRVTRWDAAICASETWFHVEAANPGKHSMQSRRFTLRILRCSSWHSPCHAGA